MDPPPPLKHYCGAFPNLVVESTLQIFMKRQRHVFHKIATTHRNSISRAAIPSDPHLPNLISAGLLHPTMSSGFMAGAGP